MTDTAVRAYIVGVLARTKDGQMLRIKTSQVVLAPEFCGIAGWIWRPSPSWEGLSFVSIE